MTQELKRTNLTIPVDVFRKARAKAVSQDKSLSGVITAFLRAWLSGDIELPEPTEPRPKAKAKSKGEKT